jgi:hypothetical protein
MKTAILDRSEYDVFFRERKPGEKRFSAREKFLSDNSPYRRNEVLVETRGCRIHDKDYDMITVIRKNRRHGGMVTPAITQTAMLVSLYGSSGCSTVQCGDEYLVLDGEPSSMYTGLQDCALPAPGAHITKKELAGKNHHTRRLFSSQRIKRLAAVAALLCSCTIMTAMMQAGKYDVPEVTERIPEETVAVSRESPEEFCFWDIFLAETTAVRAAGGRIDSYRFNRNESPQTNIAQTGADAGMLAELMGRDKRISEFRIGDISFSDDTPHFSLSAESPVRMDTGEDDSVYLNIAQFRKFANAQGCVVESIRIQSVPRYTIRLPSNGIPRFIPALWKFCTANGQMPSVFDIAIDRASGSSVIILELFSSAIETGFFPECPTVRDIAETFPIPGKKNAAQAQSSKSNEGISRVGVIRINQRDMTFDKSENGKISVKLSGVAQ